MHRRKSLVQARAQLMKQSPLLSIHLSWIAIAFPRTFHGCEPEAYDYRHCNGLNEKQD